MITNDATLLKVKHEVLYEVAKLAYEGRLDDERDNLPYKMVPGPQPFFRCCIYREREVIRQRIRLAEGKAPGTEDDGNVVQIINSACEGCPISRYVVTDNCQKCMGRACQQACRFGAISMGRDKSYIDPSKCKECGQCAKACPYNAIADLMRPCIKSCPVGAISVAENGTGIAVIDKDKCIDCGSCIHKCPFGAIGSKSYIVDIINDMRAGKKVFAMFAPATYGQFGYHHGELENSHEEDRLLRCGGCGTWCRHDSHGRGKGMDGGQGRGQEEDNLMLSCIQASGGEAFP